MVRFAALRYLLNIFEYTFSNIDNVKFDLKIVKTSRITSFMSENEFQIYEKCLNMRRMFLSSTN